MAVYALALPAREIGDSGARCCPVSSTVEMDTDGLALETEATGELSIIGDWPR